MSAHGTLVEYPAQKAEEFKGFCPPPNKKKFPGISPGIQKFLGIFHWGGSNDHSVVAQFVPSLMRV